MHSTKARCGKCEHVWDILECGSNECPICGSDRVDCAHHSGASRQGRGSFGSDPAVSLPGLGQLTDREQAILHASGVAVAGLLAIAWTLACSAVAGICLGLSTPIQALPFGYLIAAAAALAVAKAIVTWLAIKKLDEELAGTGVSTDGAKRQLVAGGIVSAVTVIGLATLVGIWWPAVAACALSVSGIWAVIITVLGLAHMAKAPAGALAVAAVAAGSAVGAYHLAMYAVAG